jgi:RNA polymerase sigma factor (sigma-70 family)
MSWLARIADHLIADEARSQARQKRNAELVRFRSVGNPGGPEPVDPTTPSRIFTQNESIENLLARLDALPPDYRQAILLAKVQGLSSAEMATQMGRSREAVAVLLHRALQRLRATGEGNE